MLYIAFVCIFLSIFLFTYNKNHLSKKKIDFQNAITFILVLVLLLVKLDTKLKVPNS